ncbi:MAG: transglycosylase domain-containing protein [bacterium]|nr:transglycosylase domain-containing protein [bacterium]
MPRKKVRKQNDKSVQIHPLKLIAGVLVLVGKPFFYALLSIVIGALFLLSIVGKIVRTVFESTPKRFSISNFLKLERLKIKKFLSRVPKFKVKIRFKPALIFILLFVSFLSLISYFLIFRGLPDPHDLTKRNIEVSTKIYDKNGELLYKIYKDKNRTIVSLDKISQAVRLATLAAEDAEFYNHPGFSIRGISRAFFQNIKNGKIQGGSTITQQLVKNALLSPERTLTRKIKELILSVEVEALYSKDQILEMYLNEVSYGGTAYGIEEASLAYFGKDVWDLNLAESAFIAGLPKSPTKYSPFGQDPSEAFVRQKEVLYLMKVNKYISEDERAEAEGQRITFVPKRTEIKAPHFVMYVRNLLVDRYGEEMVEKGGLEVTTTLDLKIQELAEKTVKEEVDKLKPLHVGNGAALVIDPNTGEILAMVGSRDYFDIAGDGNVNVTIRPRQPGSSIKIVNYTYALSNGFAPGTILDDSPVAFSVSGQPLYTPKNYDGEYRGRLSLRSAFAESRNIPAVKTLATYGVIKMIEQGQLMGITTWDDTSRFGLSLTLGGGEVKLIDLARVYATIATGGKRPEIQSIAEVKNYKGKILERGDPFGLTKTQEVVDPRVAYMITDILKDPAARAPSFGTNSALVIPNHPEVAVKTGTSNDLKDNLTAGYTQKYLVVTWVGNNDGSPMSRIASGVTGASPIWNKIMRALLQNEPSVDWNIPSGLQKINICVLTATLPCNGCPTKQEWFLEENRPTKVCKIQDKFPANGGIVEPAARIQIN